MQLLLDTHSCHLSYNIADWFHNAASFHCAASNTWQQRSECKVIAWWYHFNLIGWIFQVFQKACPSPTSSKYHNLLFIVHTFGCIDSICTIVWFCFRICNESTSSTTNDRWYELLTQVLQLASSCLVIVIYNNNFFLQIKQEITPNNLVKPQTCSTMSDPP